MKKTNKYFEALMLLMARFSKDATAGEVMKKLNE